MNYLLAQRAANLYNRLTSPSALRSDTEHARCRRAATRVIASIRRHNIPVTEWDNGKLYVAEDGIQRLF